MTASSLESVMQQNSGPKPMKERERVLESALALISGDRHDDYGEATQNFADIAKMWEGYLRVPIQPHDVGVLMSMVKYSRIRQSPLKQDSWDDAAGYVALGSECAQKDKDL